MSVPQGMRAVAVLGFLIWTGCSKAVAEPMTSVSVGSPNNGSLLHGQKLPATGTGFLQNPNRPNPEAGYGTEELTTELTDAASQVHAQLPGGELVINDISLPNGGPIRHHGSHQSGRDADVLFYIVDRTGEPMPSKGVPLDKRGYGWDFKELMDPKDDVFVKLDAPRTWRLVRALAEHPDSSLQRIFVVEHVRALLLQEARRTHTPRRLIERAGDLMCQPAVAHDDHFHFRFFCAPDDIAKGCQDTSPMYPWRRTLLKTAGLSPVMATYRKRPSHTVSRAQARQAAGPMHRKVLAFLVLQDRWSHKPSPGRRWCP